MSLPRRMVEKLALVEVDSVLVEKSERRKSWALVATDDCEWNCKTKLEEGKIVLCCSASRKKCFGEAEDMPK